MAKDLEIQPAKKALLPNTKVPTGFYRVHDLEVGLLKRRRNLQVRRTEGRTQLLSESLCVAFHNQFDPTQPTFDFLAELISYEQVSGFLDSRKGRLSIFSRRGSTGPNGPLSIRTHAFRHWLNTLADQGGLSDVELARWMGRRDLRQNAAYKHGTVGQRVLWAQEMLKTGQLHGSAAAAYGAIADPVRKEEFLKTFVNVVHFTPYGVCTHDFALAPCTYHLNCLSGCSEYLRTQGDVGERKNLIQLRAFTAAELEKAEHALQRGTVGAGNWIDFNRRTLVGIDAALAVDNDPATGSAETMTQVFPTGRIIGSPFSLDAQ